MALLVLLAVSKVKMKVSVTLGKDIHASLAKTQCQPTVLLYIIYCMNKIKYIELHH